MLEEAMEFLFGYHSIPVGIHCVELCTKFLPDPVLQLLLHDSLVDCVRVREAVLHVLVRVVDRRCVRRGRPRRDESVYIRHEAIAII